MRDYDAKLVIHGLPTMSKKRVQELVKWLLRIAREIQVEPDKKIFASKFTARLMK